MEEQTDLTPDLAQLREVIAQLVARVQRIEDRVGVEAELEVESGVTAIQANDGLATDPGAPNAPTRPGGAFWALDTLQSTLAEHPSTESGAVMMVGSLTLPTGAPIAWQQGAGTEALFDSDWDDRAAAFAALGHPVRLELLRQILSGVHATADLAAIEPLGTTGQLHHHLRQLVAAGWVKQAGRGSYEVPAARIVPLLVALIGAE